jgi:hypothetical protein
MRRLLLAAATAAPLVAGAETWTYQLYSSTTGEPTALSYISVEERSGKSVFRMVAAHVHDCFRQALPAQVARTAATTIIEIAPAFVGCDHVRFVIRNDGSGGERQIKDGEGWRSDGLDRRLTPRK